MSRPGTPSAVIGSPVSSSTISTSVRFANSSCTRTSGPGTGAATRPASTEARPIEATVAFGKARARIGRRSSNIRSPANRTSSTDPASCSRLTTHSATALSFIGSPTSTWIWKLAISSAIASSGVAEPTGKRTFSTGEACSPCSMNSIPLYSSPDAIKFATRCPGFSPARTIPAPNAVTASACSLARPRRELRRSRGAPGLVDARVGERPGQQGVLRPPVRHPERSLVHDRKLGDVRDRARDVLVRLARRTASASGRSRPAPATTSVAWQSPYEAAEGRSRYGPATG